MKIAIIGAGFSGLASCWELMNQFPECLMDVFDPKGIGGGASGIAAGLLHPFAGLHAKLNRYGFEGWNATCQLLQIASDALQKPVARFSGVLRLATDENQKNDYTFCHTHYGVEWWDEKKCQSLIGWDTPYQGIFIRQGAIVDSSLYLQGLWKACELKGAKFLLKAVQSFKELDGYDLIILAAGGSCKNFSETSLLPLGLVKGQLIELCWPSLPKLKVPLNSLGYLICHEQQPSCIAGATFERDYKTPEIDLSAALKEIKPKIEPLAPFLDFSKVLDCRAGFRVSTEDHLPLVKQLTEKLWIITGMGSKGLLYHALYASFLARKIQTSYNH